ncbi:hypothetical protein MHYP_G00312730 [Metynnis hypsauchen]
MFVSTKHAWSVLFGYQWNTQTKLHALTATRASTRTPGQLDRTFQWNHSAVYKRFRADPLAQLFRPCWTHQIRAEQISAVRSANSHIKPDSSPVEFRPRL